MTIDKAVKQVVKHIQKTGSDVASAVREMWAEISLPASALELLAKEGFSDRVSASLRNPVRASERETSFVIERIPSPRRETISVRVQILHDTMYEAANGARKTVLQFSRDDWRYRMSQLDSLTEGIERHKSVAKYVYDRLVQLRKSNIAELAPGEQEIIAKRLEAAMAGREGQKFDARLI